MSEKCEKYTTVTTPKESDSSLSPETREDLLMTLANCNANCVLDEELPSKPISSQLIFPLR